MDGGYPEEIQVEAERKDAGKDGKKKITGGREMSRMRDGTDCNYGGTERTGGCFSMWIGSSGSGRREEVRTEVEGEM